MSVQQRFNGLQNEHVRLYHSFYRDGSLLTLPSAPSVRIVDTNGVDTLDTITATEETIGTYYVDYFVPLSLSTGQYFDSWTYQFDDGGTDETVTKSFAVHSKDAILNFVGVDGSNDITPVMAQLINDLSNEFIYEAQHIPIHWEQAQRTSNKKISSLTFSNWNKEPRPLLRLNGELLDKGWYADYNGNVVFEQDLESIDTVTVDYKFAYFSDTELAGFIKLGLQAMNSIPPPTSYYTSVQQMPQYWTYGVILMAAIHALRRLVFGLNFQERAIIFGEPGTDAAKQAQSNFQQLYNDYNTLWMEISKGIKKALPPSSLIIIPEYTLPGGRARWYRYAFGING